MKELPAFDWSMLTDESAGLISGVVMPGSRSGIAQWLRHIEPLGHSGLYDLEGEVAHLDGDEDEIGHGGEGHHDRGQRDDSPRRASAADAVSRGDPITL
jgi:hypothetical protein